MNSYIAVAKESTSKINNEGSHFAHHSGPVGNNLWGEYPRKNDDSVQEHKDFRKSRVPSQYGSGHRTVAVL